MDNEMTELFESADGAEYDGESDYSERRRRWRPVPRPSGRSPTPPQQQQGFVSRTEYNAAMESVRAQLTAASNGLRALDGRVNTLAQGQERMGRDLAARRRETEALRRDLRQTREMAALLPLISNTSRTVRIGNQDVLAPSGNNLGAIAPLLLLGVGDSSGPGGMGGSDGGGGMGGMMLPLVLILASSRG